MSNARLANLDARLHHAFASVGLADIGSYRASTAAVSVGVRCMVDRASQQFGSQQQAGSGETFITLLHQPGVTFAPQGLIDVAGERFRLSRADDLDESAQRWAVVSLGAVPS